VTGLLAALTRTELDTLTADIEHGHDKAHIALRNAPIGDPVRLAAACGVAQDCMSLLMDCYDESILRVAEEFDRVWELGGDNVH
jgi:hypothetical protein